MGERLGHVEDAVGERLGHVEHAVGDRLGAVETWMARMEGMLSYLTGRPAAASAANRTAA